MGTGLRPGAKALDKPLDPEAGVPVLDSTGTARLSAYFKHVGADVRRLCGAGD